MSWVFVVWESKNEDEKRKRGCEEDSRRRLDDWVDPESQQQARHTKAGSRCAESVPQSYGNRRTRRAARRRWMKGVVVDGQWTDDEDDDDGDLVTSTKFPR